MSALAEEQEVGRLADLEKHGRAYGQLRLAVAFTIGLTGDDAKVSKNWQSDPHRLSDADHGAAILRGRGVNRNPVVALRTSNLIGVDVDGTVGLELYRSLVPRGFPPTVAARSGRADGGWHLYYRPPDAGAWDSKIEFSSQYGLKMSSDGYLVLPPALHPTGTVYAFVKDRAPWEREIAVMPAAMLRELAGHKRVADETARADDASPIAAGGRHAHLLRVGCAMRRAGAREESIAAALLAENEHRCVPPKGSSIVRALAKDIVQRYPPGARA